ncbi:unnamed protein product [Protopolystoma xenopodis]|uniref:Uncharacterized protein n=1 Tax=Protopolystoma xenopodis TaxID=117903 RepID=A0A3S5BMC2_9PLAT|nr:unnamed protein product [Protopolystoma xenopodis]
MRGNPQRPADYDDVAELQVTRLQWRADDQRFPDAMPVDKCVKWDSGKDTVSRPFWQSRLLSLCSRPFQVLPIIQLYVSSFGLKKLHL